MFLHVKDEPGSDVGLIFLEGYDLIRRRHDLMTGAGAPTDQPFSHIKHSVSGRVCSRCIGLYLINLLLKLDIRLVLRLPDPFQFSTRNLDIANLLHRSLHPRAVFCPAHRARLDFFLRHNSVRNGGQRPLSHL